MSDDARQIGLAAIDQIRRVLKGIKKRDNSMSQGVQDGLNKVAVCLFPSQGSHREGQGGSGGNGIRGQGTNGGMGARGSGGQIAFGPQ